MVPETFMLTILLRRLSNHESHNVCHPLSKLRLGSPSISGELFLYDAFFRIASLKD